VEKLIQVGIALRAILGESRQLGWHAVPTLPDTKWKGERGAGCWKANGRDAVAPLPDTKRGTGEREVGAAEPSL